MKKFLALLILFPAITSIMSGQFAPAAGMAGSDAIWYDTAIISGWASKVKLIRGFQNIASPDIGYASSGIPENALGRADNIVVSLGDGGVAVVGFDNPITNIPGFDFAVFENSFDGSFLELAHIEVSSDSTRWVRFPSVSETPAEVQVDAFGTIDPVRINNLAGKYRSMYGTPFDLAELIDSSGIDINNILFVRIVDVVGSVDPLNGSFDSGGNIINDPWPTPFPSSGFDLDAVAILGLMTVNNNVREYITRIYPVPAENFINVDLEIAGKCLIRIIDRQGSVLKSTTAQGHSNMIDVSDLAPGIYIINITDGTYMESGQFVKQ